MTERQGPLHGRDAVRTPPISTAVNQAANAAEPIAGIGDTTAPIVAEDGLPVHPQTPAQHAAHLAKLHPTPEQMDAAWHSRMAPPEPAMPLHSGVVTPAQQAALAAAANHAPAVVEPVPTVAPPISAA